MDERSDNAGFFCYEDKRNRQNRVKGVERPLILLHDPCKKRIYKAKPYKRYTQLLRKNRKDSKGEAFGKQKRRSIPERLSYNHKCNLILFCFYNDFFESIEILDSDFRKHLSVDLDICFVKKTDKLAV